MYNIAIAPIANDTAQIIARLRAQIDRLLTALRAERQATVGAELALPYSLDTAPACGQGAWSDAMTGLGVRGVEQLPQRPRLPRPIGRHLIAALDLQARSAERLPYAPQGPRHRLPRPIGRRLIAEQLPYEPQGTALLSVEVGAAYRS